MVKEKLNYMKNPKEENWGICGQKLHVLVVVSISRFLGFFKKQPYKFNVIHNLHPTDAGRDINFRNCFEEILENDNFASKTICSD